MGMATKAGLIGRWRIVRRIEDRLGPDATFEGEGSFAPHAAGLAWEEAGAFRIGDSAAMAATRQYLWRFVDDRIHVDYANGAPFHDFAPDAPAARHLCGDDLYIVDYSFDPPDAWRAIWRVTGPRKNYVSTSWMTRL